MLTDKKISIIVICYNDGGSVREMYRRVTEVMRQVSPNYELIYVNDKSPDNAMEVLRQVAGQDRRVIVISHARNFGGQAAYTTGLKYCTGDAAILLDGDIQDPPELFPELVKQWNEGYDVVYGERIRRKGNWFWRLCYKIFYRIFKKMAYLNIPLDASDFGLMSRRVIDAINTMPENDRYIRGLRAWVGYKSIGIPYTRAERFSGVSNNSFLWSVTWAKRLILSFSYKPLEWISYLAGFMVVVSAVTIVGIIIAHFALGTAPRGIDTILVVSLFMGALQLLCFSVIAEYLARMFEEIKARPKNLVDEIINDYKPRS